MSIARKNSRRVFLLGGAATLVGIGLAGYGIAELLPRVEVRGGWRKIPQNPVVGGVLGTCFDPFVLYENGLYRMWFSWRPKLSIAYCESSDGIHWSTPTIALPPSSSGWEDQVNRPVVVRTAEGYHMWYTGQTDSRSWIGYATSSDSHTWVRVGQKPVFAPEQAWEQSAVMCPHVIWDDAARLYMMWYSGGEQYEPNAIGYATSTDGVSWTRDTRNPIFRPDPSGTWDKAKVTACHVSREKDGYVMFYIGFTDVHTAQIGVARSVDGITGWQRLAANPIISPGAWGAWDHDAVYKPTVVHADGGWRLWYNGRFGTVEQIGMAVHDGDDLGF